jgi:hypothetical protein
MPPHDSQSCTIIGIGEVPLSIACESGGTFTSFKMNDAGKMMLVEGR